MNRVLAAPILAVMAAAVTMIVSACGSGTGGGAPTSSPATSSGAVGNSATTSGAETTAVPHGVPDSAFSKHKQFTGAAVDKYGQSTLQAAYKEMVNFAFATGWNSTLVARNSAYLSRADVADAVSYMTPAMRKDFLAVFTKVIQGDKAATTKLEESMFFGVTAPNGLKAVQTGKVVTNRRFTEGSVGLNTSKGVRLQLAFGARADIQMLDATGGHKMVRTTRMLRYVLVLNSGTDRQTRPFLIDSWSTTTTMNTPVAVP